MRKRSIVVLVSVTLFILAYIGITLYVSGLAAREINNELVHLRDVADVSFGRVSLGPVRRHLHVRNIRVFPADNTPDFSVDRLILRRFDRHSEFPHYLSLTLRGVRIDPLQLGDYPFVAGLAYDQPLIFNLELDYRYNAERREINIRRLSIEADGVGRLQGRGLIGNLQLDGATLSALPGNFQQLMLHEVSLRYEDDSLLQRLIIAEAYVIGIAPEDNRRSIVATLNSQMTGEQDAFIATALSEAMAFVENPEVINVTIAPPRPQPLERIIRSHNFADLINLLEIKLATR